MDWNHLKKLEKVICIFKKIEIDLYQGMDLERHIYDI